MRLCIRTLLLTVALLSTVTSSANAGCCIPIFDPFHWLFGCGGYQGCCPPPACCNPGFGGYQPAYPGVMQPCAPCAPAYPLQGLFRPVPAPAIFQHAWDPCGSQCQPMMAYQPQQIPMAQQYLPPAPMMAAPAMGCDAGCGGMEQIAMMPEMAPPMIGSPMMAADPGCCGDAGQMMDAYPQPAMAYSGYGMQNWAAAQPAMAWAPPGPGYPGWARDSSLPPSGLGLLVRPRIARRDTRRMIRTWRRMDIPNMYGGNNRRGPLLVPRPYAYPMPMSPQAGYAPGYAPAAYPQMMYSQPMDPMAYSQMPVHPQTAYQNQPMPMQGMWSPSQPAWSAPQASWSPEMTGTPMVAGDIMGDHEYSAPTTAMVPVIPNSYRGAVPVRNASMSRPLVTTSSQYTKSVR